MIKQIWVILIFAAVTILNPMNTFAQNTKEPAPSDKIKTSKDVAPIQTPRTKGRRRSTPKKDLWEVSLLNKYSYTTNLIQISKDEDDKPSNRDDHIYDAIFGFKLRPLQEKDKKADIDYMFMNRLTADPTNGPYEFFFHQVTASFTPYYTKRFWGKYELGFNHMSLDEKSYMRKIHFENIYSWQHAPRWRLDFGPYVSFSTFFQNKEKNGPEVRAEIGETYIFSPKKAGTVGLKVYLGEKDTFDPDSTAPSSYVFQGAELKATYMLPWKVIILPKIKFEHRNYKGMTTAIIPGTTSQTETEARKDRKLSAGVMFVKSINKYVTVLLDYKYDTSYSNLDSYEYDQHTAGIMLGLKY